MVAGDQLLPLRCVTKMSSPPILSGRSLAAK